MSDTRRAHLAPDRRARKGGTPKALSAAQVLRYEAATGGVHTKPHKQRRVNERAKLRKEWS